MRLTVDDRSLRLSTDAARRLQERLADAVTGRREFLRTAGEHRPDGAYVVERRGADSSGNRKVFGSFAAFERLYERLPGRFTADDVGGAGITGSRRHMVVRHFAEHPGFDCSIATRNPLTVEKSGDSSQSPSSD
ncbi:MAG: hypothetical protein V5A23_03845 [Halobacteriales archaeon]